MSLASGMSENSDQNNSSLIPPTISKRKRYSPLVIKLDNNCTPTSSSAGVSVNTIFGSDIINGVIPDHFRAFRTEKIDTDDESSDKNSPSSDEDHLVPKHKLLDLIKEVDPNLQVDEDVVEILLNNADSMFTKILTGSWTYAQHRRSNAIEFKDVQLYLDRASDLWMPGFGNQEARSFKKLPSIEAHRQRLQLMKKSAKKY